MTSEGHPDSVFKRAIERGKLMVAEDTLRVEIPRPSLGDLLELTALIALKAPQRQARVSARWLQQWLEATDDATVYDASFVASCLQAIGSRHHERALASLRDMAEEATRAGPQGW